MSVEGFTPAVRSIMEQVRELVKPDDPTSWDKAWQANLTPWDAGNIQPPLREVIESGAVVVPPAGRALVPGCGAGYDAIYIADALGLHTLGIDAAKTAVAAALKNLASKHPPPKGGVTFDIGDFFLLPADEKFDLAYDYTFFVAIPPTQRAAWGHKMAELIKPDGFLITLAFPLDAPTELGPPYFVRVEHYEEVLAENFTKVLDKVPEVSSATHGDRERIVLWKRSQ